jgi:formate dehydrogenase major subunit
LLIILISLLGRLLEHFHEGNLTYRIEGIREKTPDTFVEVSPDLA